MAKKTYFILFLLFLIIFLVVFFMRREDVEAPTLNTETTPLEIVEEELIPNTGEAVINNGVKEFTITGKDFSFVPNTINVNKGDKVRILFQNTIGFHDFKIDEYGLATKQTKAPYQEILEFTADKVGIFEYYCSVGTHRVMGMKGILNVE